MNSRSPRPKVIARLLLFTGFVVEFVLVVLSRRCSTIRDVIVAVDLIVLVGVIVLVILAVRRSRRSP